MTLANGADVTCTITNTAQQPTLTLVKTGHQRQRRHGRGADWTLTATGPTDGPDRRHRRPGDHRGDRRDRHYTLVRVRPDGVHRRRLDVRRRRRPSVPVTDGAVTVGARPGRHLHVVNDDQPALLTLRKVVVNDHGGHGRADGLDADRRRPDRRASAARSGSDGGHRRRGERGHVRPRRGRAARLHRVGLGLRRAATPGRTTPSPSRTARRHLHDHEHVRRAGAHARQGGRQRRRRRRPSPRTGRCPPTAREPVSGATGSAAVTDAPVAPGAYTLSESGPAGYASTRLGLREPRRPADARGRHRRARRRRRGRLHRRQRRPAAGRPGRS